MYLRWLMWRGLIELTLIIALISGLIAVAWRIWSSTTAHDWHVIGVYALCEFLLAFGFGPDKSKKIRGPDGEVYVSTIEYIAEFAPVLAVRDRILGDLLWSFLYGSGIGVGILIGTLLGVRVLDWRRERRRRRGVEEPHTTLGPGRRAMLLAGRAVRRLPTVKISVQLVPKADRGIADDGAAASWRGAASGGNPHPAISAVAAPTERRRLIHQPLEQSERKGAPVVTARPPARDRGMSIKEVVNNPELPFGEHAGGEAHTAITPAGRAEAATVRTSTSSRAEASRTATHRDSTNDERHPEKQPPSPPRPPETRRTVSSGADRPGDRNKPHSAASRGAAEAEPRISGRDESGGAWQSTETKPAASNSARKKKTRGRSQDFY